MTLSYVETTALLAEGAVRFPGTADLVIATGPDARSYLQGQLSQDLDGLGPGETAESLVLTPQGKLDAYVRVRIDADRISLIVASGYGAALVERLARFRLRVKVEVATQTVDIERVRGPRSPVPRGLSFRYAWPNLVGYDVVDAGSEVLALPVGDGVALEVARIRAGEPVMGRELDGRTIPQETSLAERAVSFTKGCYTGQELVARLDARGANVARTLCGVVVQPGSRHRMALAGEPIRVGDKEAGVLTSAEFAPDEELTYGLAYLRRGTQVPCRGDIVAAGGEDVLAAQLTAVPR